MISIKFKYIKRRGGFRFYLNGDFFLKFVTNTNGKGVRKHPYKKIKRSLPLRLIDFIKLVIRFCREYQNKKGYSNSIIMIFQIPVGLNTGKIKKKKWIWHLILLMRERDKIKIRNNIESPRKPLCFAFGFDY